MPYNVGTRVKLVNLEGTPEYNNTEGVVVDKDEAKGVWKVQLYAFEGDEKNKDKQDWWKSEEER